jgi:selenocysteine lyase/cysteine desulfurase
MINSSNFGEQPHNAISPMSASIKAEVEDVRESVAASELIPEDSLYQTKQTSHSQRIVRAGKKHFASHLWST